MFQKTILSKYLQTQNPENLITQWDLFRAHFHNPVIQANIRNSKEEQYQEGFLRDLFVSILGYQLNPAHNFNLTTEYKNIKDSKKADGAIIINDKVIAIIELKGTNTTDLSKIEDQAFGYKNNQENCKYVITSNFEKLRFYVDNAIENIEFNLFELSQDQFNLMYLILAFENIKNDIPKKLKDESLNQEDIITKKLYKDYSVFKRELFQNLTQLNPEYDPLILFQKSQKLLDRLLFLFFGEDRGLLPPNYIRKIIGDWNKLKDLDAYFPLYDRYKQNFEYLNSGSNPEVYAYNGGLFKEDEILDHIKIDDKILYEHTYKLSQYDFASEVDVNILGHIFENSLNEIDEIKAELEGQEIDKSKSKRKKDGVFYTPKYITKYIVENTVGKLCEEKKTEFEIVEEEYSSDKKRQQKTLKNLLNKLDEYRAWLLQITIVDPACGSGAFLNEALNFLIKEHQYIDELEAKLRNVPIIFSYHSESILEHNLFGVDLNEESVEIAKLSLWLRTAEPNRKLNSLNNNIKCGNSLIDDPEVAGEKAFNWKEEFPQVFAKGGFDVVIGNPPYVNSKGLNFKKTEKDYFYSNYKTAIYQIDTYILFLEKLNLILKNKGKGSYIIPNSWLNNLFLKDVRKYILNNFFIIEIANTPSGVFSDANVDTIILNVENTKKFNSKIKIFQLENNEFIFNHFSEQNDFIDNPNHTIDIFSDRDTLNLINKIESNKKKLNTFCKIGRGVGVYHKRVGHTKEIIAEDPYQSNTKKDNTFVPYLRGKNVGFYSYQWQNDSYISYGNWLAEPREKDFFEGNRIVLRQIPGKEKLLVTFLEDHFIIDQSVFIARFLIDEIAPKYILSILGSKLIFFYFKNKYSEFDDLFPKVKLQHFKDFPIRNTSPEFQKPFIEKADEMLSLNKTLQEISAKFQRTCERKFENLNLTKKLQDWYNLSYADFIKELSKQKIKLTLSEEAEWADYFDQEKSKALEIQSKIASTDKEIDQMVYELYGLSEEEIGIVEN
ncbi:N-6 DNA Methylase [Kaistella chaponensis]|uniref:site-specific DNA-methyltransferase (adenine-specific) n=1 Tax=Kaistella chaponensis TaxID=713588 RepID=A0A1N7NCL0_9FLAO|nr:TaqI-like C-terminal specificity domain-containing protein [Kaistella chaponensis]SIS96094.1 N-6 DNA Methylase [Kaistella chaponensis]